MKKPSVELRLPILPNMELIATQTTEEIQLSGVPLGSFNDVHFDQTTTTFNSGDILVIISDGLPEAPNLAGDYLIIKNYKI